MPRVPKLARRAGWAIPAGALVVTGGVLAGTLISSAQAAPGLPARTAAQLLAEVADSTTPPLTGTVVETASFGLPALPATGTRRRCRRCSPGRTRSGCGTPARRTSG